MFVVPIKLPFTCTVSYQHIKRCSQDAKSMDIHLVEIQEAEECPNFLQSCGLLSVLYALDFDWVHSNEVLVDDHTEVFHFGDFKLAFFGVSSKGRCL